MTVRAEIRPTPEPPREVVLTMPYDVAVTLYAVVGQVSGNRATTYRSDTSEVYDALASANIQCGIGRVLSGEIKAAPRPSHKD